MFYLMHQILDKQKQLQSTVDLLLGSSPGPNLLVTVLDAPCKTTEEVQELDRRTREDASQKDLLVCA